METGIYIRAKVDGKWGAVDIADPRLSSLEIVKWLRSRGGCNLYAENCVLQLIGKEQVDGSSVYAMEHTGG